MSTKARHRLGTVLTVLVALFLAGDGLTSLLYPAALRSDMVTTGWPLWTTPIIGATSLFSALLFALPRTCLLGAILATGFLGGAIATHLRIGEVGSPPEIISLVLGLAAWAALWLRGRVALTPAPRVIP